MLFLFNDRVIDIDLPENRLQRRWRRLGCGDPHMMRARDAIDFARAVVDQAQSDALSLTEDTVQDLAALIISKTGANAVQFVPRVTGPSEPRLSTIAPEALEAFRTQSADQADQLRHRVWNWSAA